MSPGLSLDLIAVETDLEMELERLEEELGTKSGDPAFRMLRQRLEAVNRRDTRGKEDIEANLRDLNVARRALIEVPVDTSALEKQLERILGVWQREYAS